MLSLQPFPFVDNTCLILVFLSEACLMCCADAAWKNKKIYDSLWQCLDKMQNERDKFLQNCLQFYRNIHKFWLIFKKNSQNLIVSLQKCSDLEQKEGAKLETLLHIESGLVWQLRILFCMAAEWEKKLREKIVGCWDINEILALGTFILLLHHDWII